MFHLIYHLVCSSSFPHFLTCICFSSPAPNACLNSLVVNVERLLTSACFQRTHSLWPLFHLSPSSLSHSVRLCPPSRDTTVKVWHVPTATEQKNLGGHNSGVTCLSAPPPEYCKRLGEDTHTHTHPHWQLKLSNACVPQSGNYRSSSSDQPQREITSLDTLESSLSVWSKQPSFTWTPTASPALLHSRHTWFSNFRYIEALKRIT